MLKNYYTIQKDGSHEIEIKKSRFICSMKRITTEAEAKEFIQGLKKTHWKANHNCSAFVLGERSEIQRSSDDGEPSGTAGVPMLEVLKKNQLINVCAVVTRYFGGTKLGAGGLIRAYTQSVAAALKDIGIVEGKLQQEIWLTFQYSQLDKLQHYLTQAQIPIKETQYSDQIKLSCLIDETQVPQFWEKVTDLLQGQVTFDKGDLSYHEHLIQNED